VNSKLRPGAQAPGESSPIKPQGILLTPGTGTMRRKTVSFGAGVVDNGGKDAIGRSGVPNDFPGKFPSPYTPKSIIDENQEPARRTALTETFEAARDGRTKTSRSAKSFTSTELAISPLDSERIPEIVASSSTELQSSDLVQFKDIKKTTKATIRSSALEDFDGDMTLDLNDPHSQSGRYWKSEYDRYHEEARVAMEKLVKYKQLAKSYARKKDAEAIDLSEKLREEQQKVANMEAKISELAEQIANRRLSGWMNEDQDLMKDLARQTALAREYGNRVNEFKAALQEGHTRLDQQSNRKDRRSCSTSMAQVPTDTSLELNKAKEQLAEMTSLRDEVQSLRLNVSIAEKKASRLQDENSKLSRDLTKVREELDKSERRRQSAETQNQERQVLLQSLQKDYCKLKELAKSQRRDAEDLLKKRHTQVAKLKKETRLLKEEAAASIPKATNQVTSHAHSENVATQVRKREEPKETAHVEDLMFFDTPPKKEGRSVGSHGKVGDNRLHQAAQETLLSIGTRRDHRIQTKANSNEKNHLLDSKVPALGRSTETLESIQKEDARKADDKILRRNSTSKPTPLAEIINNAQSDNSPERNQLLPASQLNASIQERLSSLSLNSPGPALPSFEPSFILAPDRRLHDKRGIDSPRSSGRDSHIGRNGHAPSSRMSSMSSKGRVALPSDRAAAAKARLEQKNAEKKRAREMAEGKENVMVEE
jgi:myosin heavy subunit